MPRQLLGEEVAQSNTHFNYPDCLWRRGILRDTVEKLLKNNDKYVNQAQKNHDRWVSEAKQSINSEKIHVLAGDWGDITQQRSQATGNIYAVLNMANAYTPGGGYLEGASAQEENIFRRSNCHLAIDDNQMKSNKYEYSKEMNDLINGENNEVYLDAKTPRVCIKGREIITGGLNGQPKEYQGYDDLGEDNYFLFYELRAAADNLRDKNNQIDVSKYNETSMRKKIAAQFSTLKKSGIKHVILSAFGCGAFGNPADKVAQLYQEELEKNLDHFEDVTFAIYNPGYGPDNFTPFKDYIENNDIRSLRTVCSDYKKHLEEKKEQDRTPLAKQKLDIMEQLLKSLASGSITDKKANFYKIFSNTYKPSADSINIKESKPLTCRALLAESQDSHAIIVLKVIATIFSLGIAGAFGIWNVQGKQIGDEIAEKDLPSSKQIK
jgi:hypothetical protein